MKTVCRVLGVARSHVHDLHHRGVDWKDARKGRTPAGDTKLGVRVRTETFIRQFAFHQKYKLKSFALNAFGQPS